MAKVSICVPTYNNVGEVDRLLQSIAEQDYTDYEINISDDSSNEEIAELIETYQQSDLKGKIRYVHNERSLGHIFNWNAAIQMATGEYIKIMFSDDWFTFPNSLSKLVELLDKNPQANLAFCGSRQVMLDDSAETSVHNQNIGRAYDRRATDVFIGRLKADYRNLFLGNEIGAPSAVMYRRTDTLYLFDEKSNWASDMFLYFDILQENAQFVYAYKPLISIGMHENQYTEMFSERDMRIYQDYRYLYTKYELWKSEKCRTYFTETFLVKYHQGFKEVKALQIEYSRFLVGWICEVRDTIRCFISSRIGRKG